MEKIISCPENKIEQRVQPLLDQGWKVKNMIAEHVAIAMTPPCEIPSYEKEKSVAGNIIMVLEKS